MVTPEDYKQAVKTRLNSISNSTEYHEISAYIDSIYYSIYNSKNRSDIKKLSRDIARILKQSGKANPQDIVRFYELALSGDDTETTKELATFIQNHEYYSEVSIPLITNLEKAKKGDQSVPWLYHTLLEHIRTDKYIRRLGSATERTAHALDVVAGLFPNIVRKNRSIRSECEKCLWILMRRPLDAYDSLCILGGSPDRIKQLLKEGGEHSETLYALSKELSKDCPYMSLVLVTEATIEGSSEATANCVKRIDVGTIHSIAFTREILQNAVDAGNPDAMVKLADLFQRVPGLGSEEEETKLLESASEMGKTNAMVKLTNRIISRNKDIGEYIELMTRVAELGNVDAMMALGAYYRDNGDSDSAVEWYTLAAKKGNSAAMHELGKLLMQSDREMSIYWLKRALNCGRDGAAYELYLLNKDSENEDPFKLVPETRSTKIMVKVANKILSENGDVDGYLKLMTRAADLGNVKAMTALGNFYKSKNKNDAIKWYTMAVEKGSSTAMYELGKLLMWNNDRESIYWLERALKGGKNNAAYDLYLIFRGEGKYRRSEQYLRKAYETKDPRAMKEMQRIKDCELAEERAKSDKMSRHNTPMPDDSGKWINMDDTRA